MPERTRLIGTFLPRDAADLECALDDVVPGRTCDLVELRLDALPESEERVADWIGRSPVPVVATCRRTNEGARVDRTESARLDLLAHAADAGAAWVDIEHDVHASQIPGDARVLRSAHLDRLPDDAEAFVDRLLAAPADAGKLVIDAGTEATVVDVLTLVRSRGGRLAGHVLAHPFSRAASATQGAPFTYGRLRLREGFGFSLPSVAELRDLGVGRVRCGTRVFLLLGADVSVSVSPHMLRRAFSAANVDLVSLPWSCADPQPALDAIERFQWAGAAVTIPHKRAVLLEVERRGGVVHECAAEVGATNTVVYRDRRWHAYNTDRGGLVDALREPGESRTVGDGSASAVEAEPTPDYTGRVALILGAGGAARAAVRAAQDLGARPTVWARRPGSARRLARDLAEPDGAVPVVRSLAAALELDPTLVIDCTPAGALGEAPLFDPTRLPDEAVVIDVLVSARPTALTAAAISAGRAVRTGLSMLAFQASRQLRLLDLPPCEGSWLRRAGQARLDATDRGVLLIGLRGAGKSTVGRRLGERLGLDFVDSDQRVEQLTGRSPAAWIAAGEVTEFRIAEREALESLARAPRAVIATGGGAVEHEDALASLAARSLVVWLDAPDDCLLQRLAEDPRGALTSLDEAAELAHLRSLRTASYAALANLTLETSSLDVDRCVDAICDRLETC